MNTKENLYIEADNLESLKYLRNIYKEKIKMIYTDPPYNMDKDFIYPDYFQDKKVSSDDADKHTKWLNMMYPRLMLARELLSDDGVIFISIDDHEVENLKKICNEVFGDINFIGQIAVINNLKGRNDRKDVATCHEHLIIYGKPNFESNGLPLTDEQRQKFDMMDENENAYQLRDLRKRGRPDRREDRPNMFFPIYYNQETKECSLTRADGFIEILPLRGDGSDGRWRWGKERVSQNLSILEPFYSQRSKKWGIQHRVYLNPSLNPNIDDEEDDDERLSKSKSFWMGGELSSDVARRQLKQLFQSDIFDYPKSVDFITKCIHFGCDDKSIILDFFSGSATTAHAIMRLNAQVGGNHKFIIVQMPEIINPTYNRRGGLVECTDNNAIAYLDSIHKPHNICEIGKERIRRAGEKIIEEAKKAGKDVSGLDVGFKVFNLDLSNLNK